MKSLLRNLTAWLLLFAIGVLAGAGEARAAAGPWTETDNARLRLIAESDAVGSFDELRLGLQMEIAPGWKTYWRSPGDAGFPPQLDWSTSRNLLAAEMAWPVPHRFTLFGLDTFGYDGEVVFPIATRLSAPGAATEFRALVDFLLCSEICIPYQEEVELVLPAGAATSAREAFLIEQYQAQVPDDGARSGLSLERAALTGSPEAPMVELLVRTALPAENPDVLVEGPSGYRFDKPVLARGGSPDTILLRLAYTTDETAEGGLAGQWVTFTVTDGLRGMERSVILQPAPPSELGRSGGRSLWQILLLALLGGLILNLMPCVLPVLSIKLLSAIGHGGRESGAVRLSFLASAAGILASFLVLAGVAIGLRSAGLAVGWGIQFQQPLFLVAMALVLTFFASNLFGLFEIPLPGWLSGVATLGRSHSLRGHFLTGAFATLLATPCSAPFVGTAVGFALSRGTLEILSIFTALGLGLALPYLAVAAVPALATRLPRPGAWMIRLRRLLALALVGTALWLLSVLAVQIGVAGSAVIGLLLAAIGLVLLAAQRHWLPRHVAPVAVVVLAALAVAAPALPFQRAAPQTGVAAEAWQPLDEHEIARLVTAGSVVFVDVTADWCITCQVNKALVLDNAEVAELLAGDGVALMRGDWTLPDPAISDYLASFERFGIPFNAVYGPGAPAGIALPELLSKTAVIEAVAQAADGRPQLADGESASEN
jgi:suppressor for copper-sensitivity B